MVVALPEGAVPALTAAAEAEGVSCTRIGLSGGTLLTIAGFDQLGDAGGFDAQVLAEVSGEDIPDGVGQSGPIVFRVRELAEQMGAVIPGLFA